MYKINLDESLFDDDMSFTLDAPSIKVFDEGHFDSYKNDEYDDTPFEYEPLARAEALTDHNGEAVPEGPKPGVESGIADSLIKLINDEWEAIQGYNNFRDMILSMQQNNDGDYTDMIKVIDEISNEENLHVGQLQELLKGVSPNTESISKGEEEAQEQLQSSGHEWVNGQLKVEFHEPNMNNKPQNDQSNYIDENCNLEDADDEW